MRLCGWAILGGAAWLGAAGVGQAATTQTVWQGESFLTSVSDTCTASNIAVGDYYRVVYRPKLNGTDPAEGLSFVGGRSAVLATSAAGSAMFQGSGTYKSTGVSSRATSFSSTGHFQLSISPAPILSGTEVVTISGTLTNFFAITGCTIGFSSALVQRP